jgi:hypothetical protein
VSSAQAREPVGGTDSEVLEPPAFLQD